MTEWYHFHCGRCGLDEFRGYKDGCNLAVIDMCNCGEPAVGGTYRVNRLGIGSMEFVKEGREMTKSALVIEYADANGKKQFSYLNPEKLVEIYMDLLVKKLEKDSFAIKKIIEAKLVPYVDLEGME